MPVDTVRNMICASIMSLTKTPCIVPSRLRLLPCTENACWSRRCVPMDTRTYTLCLACFVLLTHIHTARSDAPSCSLCPPLIVPTVCSNSHMSKIFLAADRPAGTPVAKAVRTAHDESLRPVRIGQDGHDCRRWAARVPKKQPSQLTRPRVPAIAAFESGCRDSLR